LEWDSDDRFCHLTTYSKPYQISRYGGGMHLCTILFGLPFIFWYSHFQNQRTYSFGFLKIFKNGQFKVSSRFFDRSLIFENRQLGLCSFDRFFWFLEPVV
jgi:hypothetical protein